MAPPGTATLSVAGIVSALAGLGGYFTGVLQRPTMPRAVYEWPDHVDEASLVTVPEDVKPGEELTVTKPDGTQEPWIFQTEFKKGDVVSAEDKERRRPKSLYVQLEKDVAPESSIEVLTPSGDVLTVELPEGAARGDRITLETYPDEHALLFKILPYAALLEGLLAVYVLVACVCKRDDKSKADAEGKAKKEEKKGAKEESAKGK
eukprot:TRINITY_DN405_c0_g1_i1.p2 TRINITY_DN405_c0_g1~~TRINITY_DN405_c0_g1_i1.p2  ORF type:complete len:205 (-),score=65.71 TRINITY_DN405_c0_g1_i1:61-675(-)